MNIILLSGGSGKRLWPLSNDVRSKQFLKIFRRNVREFYIPTASEIDELVDNGFIRSAAMTALEKEIRRRGGEDVSFLEEIWPQVSSGKLDMQALCFFLTEDH